jgi:hypothetical protein
MMPQDPRDIIADALISTIPRDETCVLQGWITVYEWAEMDGRRWLHVLVGSDRSSEHYITEWQISGYLHEALNGVWQRSVEDEE